MGSRRPRADHLVVAALTVLTAVLFFATSVGVMNSMDGPQYALTRALVERQTLHIGGYPYVSPDFALVNGEVYTKRSPGVSFLAVPFYVYSQALGHLLTPPYPWSPRTGVNLDSPVEATTEGLAGLIAVAAVVLLYLLLRELRVSQGVAIGVALVFAFGTLLWAYAASLVREPAVIMFLLLAYLGLLKLQQAPRPGPLLVIGAALGLAVFCDTAAAAPGLVLLGYTGYWLLRARTRPLYLLVLVGAFGVGLLPLVTYNLAVFGQPLAVPYHYDHNALWRRPELNFLANPLWSIPVSLVGNGPIPLQAVPYYEQYPEWARNNGVFAAAQSHYKGILIQTPLLWLGFPLALVFARSSIHCLLPLLLFLAVFLPLSAFTAFYNPNNYDTRYFLPAVAFLFIPTALVLDALREQAPPRWRVVALLLAAVLGLVSVAQGWESVLQNYGPHLTGESRGSLWAILRSDGPLSARVWTALGETFPNYANLPSLLPVLVLVLGLGYALRPAPRSASVRRVPAASLRSPG